MEASTVPTYTAEQNLRYIQTVHYCITAIAVALIIRFAYKPNNCVCECK